MIRPIDQARDFADSLRAKSTQPFSILYSPVLEIVPVPVKLDLQNAQALLFTSANAVHQFATISDFRHLPALCVGLTTAETARNYGLFASNSDGDVDDMVQKISSEFNPNAGDLVYLRGAKTSGDLAGKLGQIGFHVVQSTLYSQQSKNLSKKARHLLEAGPAILPVFSPYSAQIFADQSKNLDLCHCTAVSISQRVAQILKHCGFNRVDLAKAPNRTSMIHAIISTG